MAQHAMKTTPEAFELPDMDDALDAKGLMGTVYLG